MKIYNKNEMFFLIQVEIIQYKENLFIYINRIYTVK